MVRNYFPFVTLSIIKNNLDAKIKVVIVIVRTFNDRFDKFHLKFGKLLKHFSFLILIHLFIFNSGYSNKRGKFSGASLSSILYS